MPLERPSLLAIRERLLANLDAEIPGVQARLPRSILEILASTAALGIHGTYGFGVSIARDLFPDSAQGDALDRLASLYGLERRPDDFAEVVITFSGVPQTSLPEGTRLVRDSDALELRTTLGSSTGSGGPLQPLTVAQPLSPGRIEVVPGESYTFVDPPLGIDATATHGLTNSLGADGESDTELRERLLARLAAPAQGGNPTDFRLWALEVPGVTRAFVRRPDPTAGAPADRTVAVRLANDDEDPPVAAAGTVTEVQSLLDARAPVGALVDVQSVTVRDLDPEIAVVPDTQEVREAVEAELRALLLREGSPGATIPLSRFGEAISSAPGETDHSILSPAAPEVVGDDEVLRVGTITWA